MMIDYQKPCLIDTKCLLVIETVLSSRTFRQSINYWQVPAENETCSQRNWLIMCRARPVAILTWDKLIYLTGHVRCTYVSITTLPTNHRSVGVVTWPLSTNKDLDRRTTTLSPLSHSPAPTWASFPDFSNWCKLVRKSQGRVRPLSSKNSRPLIN